jgi:hypothetical protein
MPSLHRRPTQQELLRLQDLQQQHAQLLVNLGRGQLLLQQQLALSRALEQLADGGVQLADDGGVHVGRRDLHADPGTQQLLSSKSFLDACREETKRWEEQKKKYEENVAEQDQGQPRTKRPRWKRGALKYTGEIL